ncbi:MAG: hypothetical protein NC340_04250 [Ruminococcus flavefaciens]|nr:hypothetical protein [Ruminococcus flavefaciens]MCM1229264.1 hypothetical protein [Ruminococcus flavefaciens]
MKKLTLFMLSALMAGLCLTSCDGDGSSSDVSSESSEAVATEEATTEEATEAEPDMSEDEAEELIRSAVNEKLFAIPASEMPKSSVPGVAFNKFGSPIYAVNVTYDADANAYTADISGTLKANYAVNGAGLVANDVQVEFSASVKVMVRTGDVSFTEPFDYSITGTA